MRLTEEVTRAAVDPAAHCVIITGSDTVFAAGADIKAMAEANPIEIMARNDDMQD
jgi:enoyl-CoA hydratase